VCTRCLRCCRTFLRKAAAALRLISPACLIRSGLIPDGFSWLIEMLRDERESRAARGVDSNLERDSVVRGLCFAHGLQLRTSRPDEPGVLRGKWIGFRQPVLRVLQEREGKKFDYTYQANPGEVWEEDEFWINLSWRLIPMGRWNPAVV